MRVVVDSDRCGGQGVCCALCPEVFQLGDDGYAVAREGDIDPRHEVAVRAAIDQCPERAISSDD